MDDDTRHDLYRAGTPDHLESLTNAADAIVTGSLKTSIRVSGGVAGVDYILTNTVTTSDSQTLINSGVVSVVAKS